MPTGCCTCGPDASSTSIGREPSEKTRSRGPSMLEIRRRLRMEHALALVILAAGLVFAFLSPAFLTLPNLVDLLESYAVTTILASGVFVVLVSGGIDVSFAAITSVSQYVAA